MEPSVISTHRCGGDEDYFLLCIFLYFQSLCGKHNFTVRKAHDL